MNTFGTQFRITSYGESHGKLIGIIVDGCPPGVKIDLDKIQHELNRRRPGQSKISTSRSEKDRVKILSGVKDGYSTGAPISMIIENQDKDSTKYDSVTRTPRPSHSDYPALQKYGKWVDLRGSGRFSGRNTAGFVMAGAIASIILEERSMKIAAYTKEIAGVIDDSEYSVDEIKSSVENNTVRTVKVAIADRMIEVIESAKSDDDSVGGIISCVAEGVPAGIGDPMFHSVESVVSSAMFSIPAIKGIEFGVGFKAARMRGSEHNDPYCIENGKIRAESNNAGGIIGGITTGMPIRFNVVVKPTASIGIEQKTVNLKTKEEVKIKIEGRHDPCIVPRAVPVVEAMFTIALVNLLDLS